MDNKLNTKIGILGGGQLGKMLIESYSPMNLKYQVLEKEGDCPASLVCHSILEGSLYDEEAINALARTSDVLTYEIEHVNTEALKSVSEHTTVIPFPNVLEMIQDKGLQKEFYRTHDIPTLPYVLASAEDLQAAVGNWSEESFVLKHRKGGYDGKGVMLTDKQEVSDLISAKDASILSKHGYVIEKLAKDIKEISVIVCVDQKGNHSSYEPCEMVFEPTANLMDYLISPSSLSAADIKRCKEIAIAAVNAFNSPGIFAVEQIQTSDGSIYVNEIAPRPHNSGHHSIESCYTSQYEQLNRILINSSLGSTEQLKPALTANILGPQGVDGAYYVDGLDEVLAIEGVYIHLYGKKDTRPYRKLGHFTVLANDAATCIAKMNEVRKHLRIAALN